MSEDVFRLNSLFDFYGELLTENQRSAFMYYYHMDYTLNEISEKIGISKQGVSENLKRAIKELENYERVLKLEEKYNKINSIISEVDKKLELLKDENYKEFLTKKLTEITEELDK